MTRDEQARARGPIDYPFAAVQKGAAAFLAARPNYDTTTDTPAFAVLDRALWLCRDATGTNDPAETPPAHALPATRAGIVGQIVRFLGQYCERQGIDFAGAVNDCDPGGN